MDKDLKLEEQVKVYTQLAETDKNVDIGALMLNALQSEESDKVSSKQKRIAYLISVGIPPFGLFFAVRYFFSGEEDARQVAYICLVLTGLSVLLGWFLLKGILGSSGTSLEQIQQIKPGDVRSLYE